MAYPLSFIADHGIDIVIIMVGFIYGLGILKNRKDVDTINDDKKWESALKIRDTTIADLTAEIARQKDRHFGELSAMQTQIDTLKQQVDVLSNTVSGRDILIDVAKDQKLIITSVEDIKNHLTTLTIKTA